MRYKCVTKNATLFLLYAFVGEKIFANILSHNAFLFYVLILAAEVLFSGTVFILIVNFFESRGILDAMRTINTPEIEQFCSSYNIISAICKKHEKESVSCSP